MAGTLNKAIQTAAKAAVRAGAATPTSARAGTITPITPTFTSPASPPPAVVRGLGTTSPFAAIRSVTPQPRFGVISPSLRSIHETHGSSDNQPSEQDDDQPSKEHLAIVNKLIEKKLGEAIANAFNHAVIKEVSGKNLETAYVFEITGGTKRLDGISIKEANAALKATESGIKVLFKNTNIVAGEVYLHLVEKNGQLGLVVDSQLGSVLRETGTKVDVSLGAKHYEATVTTPTKAFGRCDGCNIEHFNPANLLRDAVTARAIEEFEAAERGAA